MSSKIKGCITCTGMILLLIVCRCLPNLLGAQDLDLCQGYPTINVGPGTALNLTFGGGSVTADGVTGEIVCLVSNYTDPTVRGI